MALTQKDIMDIQEILGARFDAKFDSIAAKFDDLKETLNRVNEAHQVENERRRDDIGKLYEADRRQRDDNSALASKIVKLEEWRESHTKSHDMRAQVGKEANSQRLVVIGLILSLGLWAADKIFGLVSKVLGL